MPQDTRIALFLLADLVAALQANDPDTFKRWLYGGIQDLGEPAVTELLLDWIDPFITKVEADRVSTNTNDYQFHPLLLTHTQIKCRASLPKLKPIALRLNHV
jgi:hypothetical protein